MENKIVSIGIFNFTHATRAFRRMGNEWRRLRLFVFENYVCFYWNRALSIIYTLQVVECHRI